VKARADEKLHQHATIFKATSLLYELAVQ